MLMMAVWVRYLLIESSEEQKPDVQGSKTQSSESAFISI